MEHTPTPWRVSRANPSPTTGEWMIAGSSNGYLAEVRDCGGGSVAANARRIVAAVNYCEGLDVKCMEIDTATGRIPSAVIPSLTERLFAAEAQRDELLTVLESIIDLHDSASRGKQVAETIGKARAVIATVKGE